MNTPAADRGNMVIGDRVAPPDLDDDVDGADESLVAPSSPQRLPFRWPPRSADEGPGSSVGSFPPQTPAPTRWKRIAQTIRSLETVWLAPTALPLARRVQESAWRPDGFEVYCDRCGMTIGPYESDEFGCSRCRGTRLPWSRFVRLGEYDAALAQWIKDAKFRGQRRLAFDLGALLGNRAHQAGAPSDRIAVVPVGMAWLRRLSRGYDQAAEIARGAACVLSCPLVQPFRRKNRPSQRSVPASARRSNLAGSFSLKRGFDFSDWAVLVVDDVRTSGATLIQACRTLAAAKKAAPAEIWAGVIAVTPAHDRRPLSQIAQSSADFRRPVRRSSDPLAESPDGRLDSHAGVGTVVAPTGE